MEEEKIVGAGMKRYRAREVDTENAPIQCWVSPPLVPVKSFGHQFPAEIRDFLATGIIPD